MTTGDVCLNPHDQPGTQLQAEQRERLATIWLQFEVLCEHFCSLVGALPDDNFSSELASTLFAIRRQLEALGLVLVACIEHDIAAAKREQTQ